MRLLPFGRWRCLLLFFFWFDGPAPSFLPFLRFWGLGGLSRVGAVGGPPPGPPAAVVLPTLPAPPCRRAALCRAFWWRSVAPRSGAFSRLALLARAECRSLRARRVGARRALAAASFGAGQWPSAAFTARQIACAASCSRACGSCPPPSPRRILSNSPAATARAKQSSATTAHQRNLRQLFCSPPRASVRGAAKS